MNSKTILSVATTVFCALSLSVAQAQTALTLTDAPVKGLYFDRSFGTRTFTVAPGDLTMGSAINSISIAIDFEKYDGEELGVNGGGTPFYDEIHFSLTNPAGITTELITQNSFNASNTGFRGIITFDDTAVHVVNYDVTRPHEGMFRPTGSGLPLFTESMTFQPTSLGTMSDLNTANGAGNWSLFVQDTTGGDHLGYYSASLMLNGGGANPSAVPEPGSIAFALGSLITGAGMLRRRRKN
ncbi:MAG: hypothetical protein H7308_02625 [Chthonomonadaceae bacterium]|nr:hypothetical protein [Chthonomonadaceae bacterium]